MPPRDGSVWVEDGQFCYIDDKGNKKCQDFQEVARQLSAIESKLNNINNRLNIIQDAVNFEVKIIETNSPLKIPGELEVETQIKNTGSKRGTQDVFLLINNDSFSDISLTLDSGEETKVTYQVSLTSDDVSSSTADVSVQSDNDISTKTIDLTYTQEFSVVIRSTNSPIDAGQDLTVDVDITNIGDAEDTQEISFDVDGIRDAQEVTLSPDQSKSITLTWTNVDVGNYTAFVVAENGSDSVDVTVSGVFGDAYFDVNITNIAEAYDGEDVSVEAEISNIGDQSGTQDITLEVFNDTKDTQSVSLNASSTTTITLTWTSAGKGLYDAIVSSNNDSDTEEFAVLTTGVYFGIKILSTNSPVPNGGTVVFDVRVQNIGDEGGEKDVIFYDSESGINLINQKKFYLNSLESKDITFDYDMPEEWKESRYFTVVGDDGGYQAEEIIIGDIVGENAGVIIHREPGNTIEGVYVDQEDWVEIFGDEVHFSQNG